MGEDMKRFSKVKVQFYFLRQIQNKIPLKQRQAFFSAPAVKRKMRVSASQQEQRGIGTAAASHGTTCPPSSEARGRASDGRLSPIGTQSWAVEVLQC